MTEFYYILKAEVMTMARIISKCPGCAGMLHISTLRCQDCGMELKQDFAFTQFDKLTDADRKAREEEFLEVTLRSDGVELAYGLLSYEQRVYVASPTEDYAIESVEEAA